MCLRTSTRTSLPIFLLKFWFGHLKSHWIRRWNISFEIGIILMEEKAPMGMGIGREG